MNTNSTHIRSFVSRLGNITSGQKKAIQELGPLWMLPYQQAALDCGQVFAGATSFVLEIGFGAGDATAHIAKDNPDKTYLGVEVYPSGVGSLLMKIQALELKNIRIISHDVVDVLSHMIGTDMLEAVHVFFPDPWPKKRHHKRRLLQPDFLHQIAEKMRKGAYFYMVTDWQEYAQEVLSYIEKEPLLHNPHPDFAPQQSWRPKTRFERKGEEASRAIFEIYALRV